MKELFGFAFSTNISSTIIMLVRDNEALWIAWFLSPVEVGYAKTALAIINLVQVPITPFISTTYPEINTAVTKKDWTLVRRLLKRITLISGTWTIITSIGLVLFGRWLLLFYGQGFLPAYVPMLLYLVRSGICQYFLLEPPATAVTWAAHGTLSHQLVVRHCKGWPGNPPRPTAGAQF